MLPRYEWWGVHDSCRHVQTRIDVSNVEEFARYMELLSAFDLQVTITGYINIHFQTVDETNTKRMNKILESFGLVQHVSEPTHERGGILDVVITSIDQPPTAVSVDDVCISDHMLLTWPVKLAQPSPVYVTTS